MSCSLKTKIDEALNEITFKNLRDCLGSIPNDQLEVAEPQDIITLITMNNPKDLLLAKLFIKQVFKKDQSPKISIKSDKNKSISLDYQGKCQSSAFKQQNEDFINFNDIMRSLSKFATPNLVYLNFSQSYLLEEDLGIIINILNDYKNIEAIDLEANRINLDGTRQLKRLDDIFLRNKSVQINFNGNYCETDGKVLKHVYGEKDSALAKGYIWIYESWLSGEGWKELLKVFELEALAEEIERSHRKFFETRNKYSHT
eukprot:NODE_187_length_15673_cov_0.222743.p4 type:complete len:257 gc:universal NODE_187_length_15673_cov_0.222743:4017-4787(+)